MNRFRSDITAAVMVLAAVAPAGCHSNQPAPHAKVGFYLSSPEDLHKIGRVCFLELPPEGENGRVARDTSAALVKAIAARGLFDLELVHADDSGLAELSLGSPDRLLSLENISALRKLLGCDAVIYGRITTFRAHPHMQMGLRLRLVDLRTAKVVWGIDQIWDTSDKSLEDRIEDYFEDQVRDELEPLNWRLVLVSPLAMEGFVSYETAQTLPGTTVEKQSSVRSSVRGIKRAAGT
ncbi:MAG: hypothetical protein WC869_01720 [Phycisphaerae bacterium]